MSVVMLRPHFDLKLVEPEVRKWPFAAAAAAAGGALEQWSHRSCQAALPAQATLARTNYES